MSYISCLKLSYPLLLFVSLGYIDDSDATGFFCSQFYHDIQSRITYNFTVNDSSPVGTVLRTFSPPPDKSSKARIYLTSPDSQLIGLDYLTYSLVVRQSLRPQNGEIMHINGTCRDILEPIAVDYSVDVVFYVYVQDLNDPPVFTTLPAVIHVLENMTVGSILYRAEFDNSFDLREDFLRHHISIQRVTALGSAGRSPPRMFRVNDDGDFILLQPLDYELGPRIFKVELKAQDEGEPPLSSVSRLVVHVDDLDDMSPLFTRTLYTVQVIGEKSLQGREECFNSTPPIQAEDQDRHAKSIVNYEVIDGEPGTRSYWSQFFRIDVLSGLICQRQMIQRLLRDAETGRDTFYNFTFTIKGYQIDNRKKFDTTRLQVYVIDANYFSPTFERRLYRARLAEFPITTLGSHVATVKAKDRDHGLNSQFVYELVSNPSGAFAVHPTTGEITVAQPVEIDREKNEFFEFKVRAVETHSVDRHEDETRILLHILDVNDNMPQFVNNTYRFNIKDTLKKGMPLHPFESRVRAYDGDAGDNGRVEYKVTGVWRGQGQTLFADLKRFSVDSDTGVLYLASSLRDLRRRKDYSSFHVIITASDRAAKKEHRLSSSVTVIITVEQANDYVPTFVKRQGQVIHGHGQLMVNVEEDAPIGTVIVKLPAVDEDGDEDVFLRYSLLGDDGVDRFRISDKGWLSITRPLDREQMDEYNVTVVVSDGSHEVSSNVSVHVVDINDNVPQFDKEDYWFSIKEMSAPGTLVGHVTAVDSDLGLAGDIVYTLKQSNATSTFTVDKAGGIFVVEASSILDREQNDVVQLKMYASDQGVRRLRSTVDVAIYLEDVNDNAPVFALPLYRGSVMEGDTDRSSQQVVLETGISASDADAELRNRNIHYSIEGPGHEMFTIDYMTADVYVALIGELDCEERDFYELQVVASDQEGNGLVSKATLEISVKDLNDNAPIFNSPTVHLLVPAQLAVGTKVGQVTAIDSDLTRPNNQVIYILKGGGYGKFSVDFQTGDLMLSDDINREPCEQEYNLEIEALDGGHPTLRNGTKVTIQLPKNEPPVLASNSTSFTVKEDVAVGTLVGRLSAFDPDASTAVGAVSPLSFELASDWREIGQPFKIDDASGHIYTTTALDSEKQLNYSLTVVVKDKGHPALTATGRVTVYVEDVNDHAPQFSLRRYEGHVMEDDTQPNADQPVVMAMNIVVEDHDISEENRDVVCTLVGEHSSFFAIDPTCDRLRVSYRGLGQIDREAYSQFSIKIQATDRHGEGLESQADLVIKVKDLNDNRPRFRLIPKKLHVHERILVGEVIGRVLAEDRDATAPNNQTLYIIDNDVFGKFRLDLQSGEIVVLNGLFYKPRQEVYKLKILAMDMGNPSLRTEAEINIHVLKKDFNDYKPEFQGETIFHCDEDVRIDSLIGTIDIMDADLDSENEVSLTIESTSPVPFSIDAASREIRTTGILDYDTEPRSYTFVVLASDAGDPPKVARCSVGVILEDVNDNPPLFTQAVYRHRVAVNFPADTVVATPFAFDEIDSVPSFYYYSLQGSAAGRYFVIDEQNGRVTTTANLRLLQEDVLELSVSAQDTQRPNLAATCQLVIDVTHIVLPPLCSELLDGGGSNDTAANNSRPDSV